MPYLNGGPSQTSGMRESSMEVAPARHRQSRSLATMLLVFILALIISAACWIEGSLATTPISLLISYNTLAALVLCLILTSLNLMIRWLRWHFLVRRFTRLLGTRDSL